MAFLSTAIGAVSAWAATHVIGAALIRAGLGIAFSLAASALARKLSPDDQPGSTGIATELQLGAEVPRQCVFGTRAVAGHLVYVNTYGDQNKYLEMVFVLSEGWCEKLRAVWVNGERHTLDAMSVVGNEDARYHLNGFGESFQVKWFSGKPTQGVDTELVANANPADRWTANDKLSGMCYVSVWIKYDPTELERIPDLLFEIKGLRLYDWRLDSTNGGSGAHRWSDTTTWEWSDNPAVIRYNFQRGIFVNGERVCGQAVAVYDLIHDLYTAAANICEEAVDLDAGGTEARYRAGLVIEEGVEYRDALAAIDQAMAALAVERQGAFGPIAGAAYSTVATVTDGDLVADEPVNWAAKRSRSELVNAVFASFTDPDANWEVNSAPPLVSTALETIDGGERLALDLHLDAVTSVTQAQRVAKIFRSEIRAQKTAAIVLGFDYVWLEVGDWIRWNSALFGDVTYRIMARTVTGGEFKRVRLDLSEISAAVYDWDAEEETVALPPSAHAPGTRPTTVAVFALQAGTVEVDGVKMPSLIFSWTPPDDPTIDAVVIEYRQVGDSAVTRISDPTPEDGGHEIYPALPGTDYEARATIVTTPRRTTTWTAWTSITTDPDFIASAVKDLAIRFESLQAQLQEEVALLWNGADGSVRAIREAGDELRERAAQAAALEAGRTYETRQQLKTTLVAKHEENVALIVTEQTVRADADEALASDLTVLEAEVDTNTASIVTEASARASADSALASDITLLQAQTDDATAEALVKIDAATGPAGATVSVGWYIRATQGGSYSSNAAMILQILSGGASRMVFDVDNFYVWNGTTSTLAFAISGGVTYLGSSVYAQKLVADYIEATHIKAEAISTSKIADNAVTQMISVLTAGSIGTGTGMAWVDVQSLAITRNANSYLDIMFFFELVEEQFGDFLRIEVDVHQGGSLKTYVSAAVTVETTGVAASNHWKGGTYVFTFVDTRSINGSKTYNMRVKTYIDDQQGGTTGYEVELRNRYIRLMERQK
ncbi:MAG: hypothetical protein VW338_00880 [Rhodospirillaceae bacterium]